MNTNTNATETNTVPIAPQGEAPAEASTEIDYAARYAELEAEKAKLAEESANYKNAYLKEQRKNKDPKVSEEEDVDEESKARRIFREEFANSRVMDLAREQQELLQKTFKENKELKVAMMNKSRGTPTGVGNHTESKVVADTLVTNEQIEAFKKMGWNDKKIEMYKKNYQKKIATR